MEKAVDQLSGEFRSRYSSRPRFFQAPGRVNLIGEHTDYNEGFVMPFAIDRQTIAAAAPRSDAKINAYARDLDESVTIDLNSPPQTRRGSWVDYVEGTARCVGKRFGEVRGLDMIIESTVPIGAGLSSSAALEIAVGLALVSLSGLVLDKRELAFAGQQAEHEFVGTRSGIMDQFAAIFSRSENAMLLDCRSLDIEYIPVSSDDIVLAVIDTKVKHDLATSEYNARREECEKGVRLLQRRLPLIKSLRDVTPRDLTEHEDLLPEHIRRRCRHVVSENERTIAAAVAFRSRDLDVSGNLMLQSHRSLREEYEVSCPELDFLVDAAMQVTGVFGSRMTGGGFGGSTVSLVAASSVEELRQRSVEDYKQRFGIEPDFYIFRPTNGASEVTV